MGLLGPIRSVRSTSKERAHCFPEWLDHPACPPAIPHTRHCQVLSLQYVCCLVLVSSCSSLMISDVEYISMCLFAIHIFSLVKCVKIFAPILLGCFLIIEFCDFIYSGYKSFIRCVFCKYFIPVLGLYFHCSNSIF